MSLIICLKKTMPQARFSAREHWNPRYTPIWKNSAMTSSKSIIPADYAHWLSSLKTRISGAQQPARPACRQSGAGTALSRRRQRNNGTADPSATRPTSAILKTPSSGISPGFCWNWVQASPLLVASSGLRSVAMNFSSTCFSTTPALLVFGIRWFGIRWFGCSVQTHNRYALA